jgi:sugar-specific transcriptional regulator TrmB
MPSGEHLENLYQIAMKLGLKEYEAKVYVTLLLFGPLTSTDLSKLSKVPYSRIYDVIRSLEEKGLIEISNTRPRRYKAVDPRIALVNFISRQYYDSLKYVNQLIEFASQSKSENEEEGVWIAKGKSAVDNLIRKAITSANHELLIAAYANFLKNYLGILKEKSKDVSICLVLLGNENISYELFISVSDEVLHRPTRAPQFVIPDFSQVLVIVNHEKSEPIAYEITDENLMGIFAVYFFNYLRKEAKLIFRNLESLEKRRYSNLARALDHVRFLLSKGIAPSVSIVGRLVRNGEKVKIEGYAVDTYSDPLRGVETLLVKVGDRVVSVGGRGAYIEEIEAFEIEVRSYGISIRI